MSTESVVFDAPPAITDEQMLEALQARDLGFMADSLRLDEWADRHYGFGEIGSLYFCLDGGHDADAVR